MVNRIKIINMKFCIIFKFRIWGKKFNERKFYYNIVKKYKNIKEFKKRQVIQNQKEKSVHPNFFGCDF